MKRDVIFSIVLHVLIITATLVASPFKPTPHINPNDVIRVTLRASLPGPAATSPSAPAVVAPLPAAKPVDKAKAITTKPKKEQQKQAKRRKVRPGEEASAEAARFAEQEIKTDATGEGSPFAGATVDNSNFDYPYWFNEALTKIGQNWRNTVDIEGSAVTVIYFQVLRSGKVMEAQIDQSSGIPAFDQSCLDAVERSSPFPPLPSSFADDIIGITLPFKFEPSR